jgi:TolB-like protein/Tfp pilus assembly protein PilF
VADESLLAAAARIADGEVIDWVSVTATLRSDADRAIVEELELLQQVAVGHRKLQQVLPLLADTPAHLMPDRAQWGHLELLNVVGRGSYGMVYRAWDTRLERLVALKLFHGASHPDTVMQEGRMLARVRHENVVTVHGADVIDGVAGIWMELVHGETLDHIVKNSGPLPAHEAAAIGADIARALSAVHAAALLHCDVKAQNVVREASGRVVLMDLGAGRLAPEARDMDQPVTDIAGTPRYMAPELLTSGAAATKAADIYSLGVLIYYLVSGEYPVDGKTLGELKRSHEARRTRPLSEARRGVPRPLVEIVSRALDRDPGQRPATASYMQSALTPIASAPAPVAARPTMYWWAAAALALAIGGVLWFRPWNAPPAVAPATAIRTLAVLPIKNLTGDPAKQYLADGLTEVLISNLARIRSLRVPSVVGLGAMRDSDEPPAEIAKKLGVQLLLAGSITQADSRVRLSVHVIGEDGTALWGDEIDREGPGVIAAQAEIARHLAQRFALDSSNLSEASRSTQLNPEAQDAYLKGMALWNGGPAQIAESARYFREAVEKDPGFAAAWAQLALVADSELTSSTGIDRTSRVAFAKEMAQRAIELDPMLATAYAALANVQFYYEQDFPAAERSFRKALEVGPSNAFARQRFAMFLAAIGKIDEALDVALETRQMELLNPTRSHTLGFIRYYRRDYDAAIADMRHALELSPTFLVAHFGLGRVLAARRQYDEAITEIELALRGGRTSGYLVELARVHAAAGHRDDVKRVLAELTDREKAGDRFNLDNLAYIAAAEGRIDDAFAILEEARQQKMVNMLWIAVDPRVDPLRNDPRFDQLLRRMNLNPVSVP